jgi:signal transduction histidine kinase
MTGSLRARIVAAMVATALLTSLLFGFASFVVVYTVEDRLLADRLAAEVTRQQAAWQRAGTLVAPLGDRTAIHRSAATLPADLAPQFVWADGQAEYYGAAGRHYHLQRFELPAGDAAAGGRAVAVAEVSRDLIVRPRRAAILEGLGALTLAVAAVAALIGWRLARRATAPLVRLAGEVAAPGIPAIDPAGYPRNEIGVLAAALARSYRQIEAFVAREQAFTRDASHELRTPLAVIRSGAELAADPAHAGAALARIGAATRAMEQTLDLLLALARGHAAPVAPEPVAVLPLLEQAVIDAAARFPGRRIDVTIDAAPDLRIALPPVVVALVLANLVNNVFQHADGSRLRLGATPDRIEIVDDGPGIGDSAAAFADFARGPTSGGSGLGLAIVRRLCEQHGIALAVEDGVTRGARLTLSFGAAPQA